MTEPWEPACMDADDLARWTELNRKAGHARATHPCRDCNPAFAAEMRAIDRCNGTPAEGPDTDD